MAIVYADQVSEIAIEATYGGRPVVSVLHYVNDEAAINDADKARDILNNWQDHVMSRVTNDYTLTGARWRSLDRDDLNQGTIAPDPAKRVNGALEFAGAPANVSYMIRKVTNNRQRGQRDGRLFLPGVPEAGVNAAGVIDQANITATNTALDAFIAGVNDDGFGVGGGSGLVVLNTTPASREPGTVEVDLTFRTVSAMVCTPTVGTQRERLR